MIDMVPRYILFMLVLTFIFMQLTTPSFAQETTINAIPLPIGSGARALGQGGAFIAVADDATAASWNPGALTQLERPELSVVGSFLSTHQDFDPGDTGFSLGDEDVSRGDLNYFSIAYPLKIFGKNLVAALSYQQKFDFHMKIDFDQTLVNPLDQSITQQEIDFESKGGVGALTPAISMLVLPKLSIGVAVNFYTDEFFGNFAWKEKTQIRATSPTSTDTVDAHLTFKNFQAVNVTTGLLLDIWEKEDKRLTFGAVYHTPYEATVDRVTDNVFIISSERFSDRRREPFTVDYPMSAGAGFGFRYNDALLFSMDMTWTDWSEFEQKNEDTGEKSLPLGGVPTDREIDDTYAVRFGTEYLIFRQKVIIPIRGGAFYDPRPSLDDPIDIYGFGVGSGIAFKRLSIDGAYQFRWANDADGEDFGLAGTHFDITEHLFLASIIVYF
ncbi:MAG: hypothetical protein JETT_2034 [Candidatus Jettenia ecosi]|uniref:Long-chain fatty acid transport protein n=1 Tax=Candidatus Jettenia ecosi TaxID=2494326 RepID=A0A533QAH0_9BACT|nr:MAG: hypothetical protein JETT_2034 [Candidatus Jettenia ecosi]